MKGVAFLSSLPVRRLDLFHYKIISTVLAIDLIVEIWALVLVHFCPYLGMLNLLNEHFKDLANKLLLLSEKTIPSQTPAPSLLQLLPLSKNSSFNTPVVTSPMKT